MSRPELTCTLTPAYLPEQSRLPDGPCAFAYTVRIRNTGDVTAQLIARHWKITDAHGKLEEVRGLAVVGRQPLLRPGEEFEYTSWTRLATAHGHMEGEFFCMTEEAVAFTAVVPRTLLAREAALH